MTDIMPPTAAAGSRAVGHTTIDAFINTVKEARWEIVDRTIDEAPALVTKERKMSPNSKAMNGKDRNIARGGDLCSILFADDFLLLFSSERT